MNTRGNAFVYILIAIALFGALTFALSGSQETTSVGELNEGRATIAANEILAYAAAAQNSITSLDRMGTNAATIDFVLPSNNTDFNDPPHINKLFHPEGGGLSYKLLPKDAAVAAVTGPEEGYYIGRFNNTEWTPTTAQDVLFTAYGINRQVCEELNYKITGSRTIPSVSDAAATFVDTEYHSGPNADLMISDCATCDEKPALCIDGSSGLYVFYSILVAK